MAEHIVTLITSGVTEIYSGMALGVDQWACEIVLDMKEIYPHIRLIAVRPCEAQAAHWNNEQQERYFKILAQCDDVVTMQARYTPSCIFERNRYLIENAKYVLAVYDGGTKGGTAYTVNFAKNKSRWITIIHPDTLTVSWVLNGS